MNEINISILPDLSFPIFVLSIGLAYFIRAFVIKYEKSIKYHLVNKCPNT
jgi:hypothetical protein